MQPNTLQPGQAAFVVIDMQESFRPVISDFAETSARIALMTHAIRLLNVPLIITEQYPKGLGRTANEILSVLPPDYDVIEKTAFSSCGASGFTKALEETKAWQVIVCGIEAHICVNQTVHDLLADGYQVHLLTNCITARSQNNKKVGIEKMVRSGAILSSVEMALFELMRDAKHEQFKTIQKLIK
jgi:nicotinamidase-related amidase